MDDIKNEQHDYDNNENGYSGDAEPKSENQSDNERDRSRSPVRRSRSRSPRDKRDRRDRDRDRPRRGSISTKRIYVSNIPYETRWQDLKDLFKKEIGDVAFVELYETADGKPCGAGVVEFKDKEAAAQALEKMHRYEVKGRKIVVREERDIDRRRHEQMRRGGRGNDMGMDNMGGGGGGMMGPGMGASGPMNNMNMVAGGNMNNVTPQLLQQLGVEGPVTNQLFVANLDYKVTEKKLMEIFKMAGNVLHVELKVDKEGKSRGMGTVRMEHPMEALQAISMFNGQILYERAMSVRMDKMAESGQQVMPNKLPSGLKTIGMGLGTGGAPLTNLNAFANTTGMGGGGGMGPMAGNAMAGNNMGMGGGMNNMGTGLGNMGTGMGTGMGNMGGMGNNMGGMGNMGGMATGGMGNNMGMAGMATGMGNMGTGNMGTGLADMGNTMGNTMGMNNMGGMAGGMGAMGMAGNMGGLDAMAGNRDSNFMGAGLMGSGNNMASGLGRNTGSTGRSSSTGRDDQQAAVYVRNLPYSYTWQNLKERFRHVGEVRYAAIKTENGKSKGTGIVRFANMDIARRAVTQMNGARIEGRDIEVQLVNRGERV